MPSLSQRIFDAVTDGIAIGGLLLIIAMHAQAATTGKPSGNSLGFQPYATNPNTYLFAAVACHGEQDCGVIERNKHMGTVVSFQPAHTYMLFPETVMFCGNEAERFNVAGPLVITYKKQASRLVGGVPCHELVSVDRIAEKQDLQ